MVVGGGGVISRGSIASLSQSPLRQVLFEACVRYAYMSVLTVSDALCKRFFDHLCQAPWNFSLLGVPDAADSFLCPDFAW